MPGLGDRPSGHHDAIVHSGVVRPSVSVVAPTYRRQRALPRFVEALLAQDELHELVMAVDGSDDGSVEWLTERRRSDSRLVVLDLPNRGAGPTRQAGIEAASGDVVLLLDDDVIADPGLVAGHGAHHEELSPKLVLGYMPNEWRDLPPGRRGIALLYRRAYEQHCARFESEPDFILYGFWGGNFSMPRSEFLRVGIEGLKEAGTINIVAGSDARLRGVHLYDRGLEAWRQDYRVQGRSRRLLHEAHSDVVGAELTENPGSSHVADAVGMGLPRQLRPLWRLLARDPFFAVVARALEASFDAAVRLRHLGLEVQSARALGSLETMRGVLEHD